MLINLVLNAIEAVRDKTEPKFTLTAVSSPNSKISLKVIDHGNGISPELMDKIFISFFSTSKTGSVEGEGTAFVLTF